MMEDFSGLALPPLFGGHFLEAELEPGGVELGPSGTELLGDDEVPSGPAQDQDDERREMDQSKYHALSKRCKEIEQVNEKIVGRLHQVQRLTRRLRKERRFLMKTLDSYGDDYRTAQLTFTLEDEGKPGLDPDVGADEESSSPTLPHQSAAGPKKKRHRVPKDRRRDAPMDSEQDSSVLADPRPDHLTEAR
ncbi:TCF3 fusion partner homolog [Carassius auratus]|uniref:TCF3 fusion partner homolog n=1 Tax=Carassius auratus TaxID=7957 RepID=A0A6P6R4Y9_CARAU|nr:TCF3 fusion partner homolog [Carassius auratus]XP_052435514.1 TCF3 fusion partner homolog [Carassius gibelio]